MDAQEQAERDSVVKEAYTWLRTPYHHQAAIKGVGVDCAMILIEVFHNCGLIERPVIPPYTQQWMLHRDSEKYLEVVLSLADEIEGPPLPGDVVVWKFGRTFSHGAIVVGWPRIIHAFINKPCGLEDVESAQFLKYVGENSKDQGKPRPKRYFSYWARKQRLAQDRG